MKSIRILSPSGLIVLALLGACFGAGAASGQSSKGRPGSWDNLKSLAPGEDIRVVMNNVKSYQGAFKSLNDDRITLRAATGEIRLERKDVLRVSEKVGQDHDVRNVLIGTAVGAGVGLVGGLLNDAHINNSANCTLGPQFNCAGPPNPHRVAIFTPLGGLAGAAIGGVLTKSGWQDIYRAR